MNEFLLGFLSGFLLAMIWIMFLAIDYLKERNENA